jgi:hypothetical protein
MSLVRALGVVSMSGLVVACSVLAPADDDLLAKEFQKNGSESGSSGSSSSSSSGSSGPSGSSSGGASGRPSSSSSSASSSGGSGSVDSGTPSPTGTPSGSQSGSTGGPPTPACAMCARLSAACKRTPDCGCLVKACAAGELSSCMTEASGPFVLCEAKSGCDLLAGHLACYVDKQECECK